MIFWKMIKSLTDHYDLYLIDILGMGGSSRPTFKLKTEEEVEDFFINWMECWRKSYGLESMVLGGHSFGGFICGLYACKYPQYVKKLLMFSPLGINPMPDDFDPIE